MSSSRNTSRSPAASAAPALRAAAAAPRRGRAKWRRGKGQARPESIASLPSVGPSRATTTSNRSAGRVWPPSASNVRRSWSRRLWEGMTTLSRGPASPTVGKPHLSPRAEVGERAVPAPPQLGPEQVGGQARVRPQERPEKAWRLVVPEPAERPRDHPPLPLDEQAPRPGGVGTDAVAVHRPAQLLPRAPV